MAMELSNAVTFRRTAFCFTEQFEDGTLEAYSCGKGRFTPGAPNTDYDVCFSAHKAGTSLNIQIHDDKLIQWLRTVAPLQDFFDNGRLDASISMDLLLPCYPALKERLIRDKREKQSFDALELFVRDFLQEGSVFGIFGFEDLHERNILTELHFHDIQSQYRSMSEDLDGLDELMDQLDERDVTGPRHEVLFLDKSLRPELRDAIRKYEPEAVASVLARDPGAVDAKTLCIAIRSYEPSIFRLLINHGSQVDGDDVITEPLYRAAKAGHMDAVKVLLEHDANIEGGKSCISATPLTGAASGGHLDIVQYLVENGANVDGNCYKSPLSRALKHSHMDVVEYLLSIGADILRGSCLELLFRAASSGHASANDIVARHTAGMGKEGRELFFSEAASNGHLGIVKFLVDHGADVNSTHHRSPLYCAAENGHLDVVRFLVTNGANINPERKFYRNAWNVNLPLSFNSGCHSPLAAALYMHQFVVADYLAKLGATLIQGEDNIRSNRDIWRILHIWDNIPYHAPTLGAHLEHIKKGGIVENGLLRTPRTCVLSEDITDRETTDLEDCPTIAAIRAQEHRNMGRRLLAKVSKSRQKLLGAGGRQSASVGLATFAEQLGTCSSVWKKGTRAIRDIIDGYLPCELPDIISGLQVADAMRSAVPPSELVCSKQEFVNDLHRWAALVKPDDKHLFVEIASCLWGNRSWEAMWVDADHFPHLGALPLLQELVNNLVSKSGLFDNDYRGSSGSYRLRSLRQRYSSRSPSTHGPDRRVPLTEWRPLDKPEVQEKLHTDASKPPDSEECLGVLARITVLMAGAIFGAILLYLCQSRCGFAMLCLHFSASPAGRGWVSNQILVRNCFILAMYLGLLSILGSGSWETAGNLLSKLAQVPVEVQSCQSMGGVQEHMPAMWLSNESDYTMTAYSSVSTEDTIMHDAPTDYSSNLSSDLGTSSPTTAVSISTMPTITPGSTAAGPQEEGTIHCRRCRKPFILGRNGRRGQTSNLRKHMRYYHPEDVPNHQRVMHKCKYGCSREDPDKSNIKVHEDIHCSKRKGKKPRRHGKWSQCSSGTS